MSISHLTPTEAAELDFLRWLDVSLAAFCGETPDFRARKIAADVGAKHLPRLQELEDKQAASIKGEPLLPFAVEHDEEPLALAASQNAGGAR